VSSLPPQQPQPPVVEPAVTMEVVAPTPQEPPAPKAPASVPAPRPPAKAEETETAVPVPPPASVSAPQASPPRQQPSAQGNKPPTPTKTVSPQPPISEPSPAAASTGPAKQLPQLDGPLNLDKLGEKKLRRISQALKLPANKSGTELLTSLKKMVETNGEADIRAALKAIAEEDDRRKAQERKDLEAKKAQLMQQKQTTTTAPSVPAAATVSAAPEQRPQIQPETLLPPPTESAAGASTSTLAAANNEMLRQRAIRFAGSAPVQTGGAAAGGNVSRKRPLGEGESASKQLKEDASKDQESGKGEDEGQSGKDAEDRPPQVTETGAKEENQQPPPQ